MKLAHDYTPETLTTVVDLWARLIDVYFVSTYEMVVYWSGSHEERFLSQSDITREWITALVISNGEAVEPSGEDHGGWPAITVKLISYSDYGGSDLDAANVEALRETPGVTVSTGGWCGAGSATMVLGESPRDLDDDGVGWLRHVVEIMEGLEESPLISDEAHTEYLESVAADAWDGWLGSDVRGDVEAMLAEVRGEDAAWDAMFAANDDAIREAFYAYRHPSGESWRADSATSVTHRFQADAERHVARVVFGLDVEIECEHCDEEARNMGLDELADALDRELVGTERHAALLAQYDRRIAAER